MQKPRILTGGLVGLALTAPLIALYSIGDQLAGLPFLPFDIFSWTRDILPGDVITTGIDAMVDTILALNIGELDSTAKTMEQLTGVVALLALGVAIGVVFFAYMNRRGWRSTVIPGLLVGFVTGVVMAFISDAKDLIATTDPTINALWIIGTFTAWGGILNIVYQRLTQAGAEPEVSVQAIDRRQFLVQFGGITATLTVVGAGLGALINRSDETTSTSIASSSVNPEATPEAVVLPNTDASLEPAPGNRPEYTPLDDHYRIDIAARPPVISETEWRLEVTGLVDEPVIMTLDDIRAYESMDQFITLSCISNRIGGDLISTTRWTGVSAQKLIEDWNISPDARYLRIASADGFDEYVDLSVIRRDERVMFAYEWDGVPLKQKHGFPLRIYIPERYGMKQPKWITNIEVVGEWGEGYWVRRGWSEEAIVQTASVVDTVAVDDAFEQDGITYIPVGGIAYASDRGISKVEVQVDDGEWTEARLREPLSELTWVVWRYDWPLVAGNHTFRVRCVDGRGTPQTERNQGVRPDGATGIHSRRAGV